MWRIILTDLVPIYVIMILGYLSGKRKVFVGDTSRHFNKLVLNYCLPAALFVSIVKADRSMLFQDARLSLVSLVVIIGCYFWSYFSCRKFFKHSKGESAICGLIGGAPTIGFLGYAILEPIYGTSAATGLVVAIVAIVVNAIAIPIALVLLNPEKALAAIHAKEAAAAGGTTEVKTTEGTPGAATATASATGAAGGKSTTVEALKAVHKHQSNAFINAMKEPVVWSPIIAVIIVLCGIRFPPLAEPSFELIGKANAGVAVFAAGLTLSATSIEFDWEVVYNSLIKLFLMPALFLIFGKLIGMDAEKLQMVVLAGALPPVFSGVIIGSRFQTYVRTGTSSLAFSTLLFAGTAPFWIWLARLVAG